MPVFLEMSVRSNNNNKQQELSLETVTPPWTPGNILFLTGREKDGAGAKVHFGSLVLKNLERE